MALYSNLICAWTISETDDSRTNSPLLYRLLQALPEIWQKQDLKVFTQLMQAESDLHLYLTYHFMYPSGTRIVTLSQRKPLPIIYKEIRPMDIRLINEM